MFNQNIISNKFDLNLSTTLSSYLPVWFNVPFFRFWAWRIAYFFKKVWRSGANVINFFVLNLLIFVKCDCVCPWKAFPSLMFAGKAAAYPSEAHFRRSTLGQTAGISNKHQTRLEKLARHKHSNILWKIVNYGQKSLMTLALVSTS